MFLIKKQLNFGVLISTINKMTYNLNTLIMNTAFIKNDDSVNLSNNLESKNYHSLLDNWILSLDVLSDTKKTYRTCLKQYFEYIKLLDLGIKEVKREIILQYKESLMTQKYSSYTINLYLSAIRSFHSWYSVKHEIVDNARAIKTVKTKRQFCKQPLSVEHSKQLLNYAENKCIKEYALINLLIRTGLRTIEVQRANVNDITFKGSKRVLMVQGKGRTEKDNFVVLTEKAYEPIRKYLETRSNLTDNSPLFVSNSNNSKNKSLTTRSIREIVKKALIAIGLNEKFYSAHSLRHTTAVNIIKNGGDIGLAQKTLRHSNSKTTEIYTATIAEQKRLENSGENLIDNMF